MPRKSLRPHLNQIRTWVRQGRTDAWVAHQLEVTVRDIEQFKRQNELVSDEELPEGTTASDYPEEIDLRAEDDALIAAELEAAEAEAERARAEADAAGEGDEEDEEESAGTRTRSRSRRGGRGRSRRRGRAHQRSTSAARGDLRARRGGLGLWLDPAIQENAIYAEHWAGHRPVEVAVEEDRIIIRRVGGEDD